MKTTSLGWLRPVAYRLPCFFQFALFSFGVPSYGQALTESTTPVVETPAERSKDLNKLFNEIWEDRLKHSPEFASSLGDKRYNDQLTDYSASGGECVAGAWARRTSSGCR